MMVTVIGRGHGGTRAMSHTLSASGVYMGSPLNDAGDLLPPEDMYEACRVMGKYVRYLGNLKWDFSALHDMPVDSEWRRLIESYLSSVLNSDSEHKGWKIPETTLVYPWIIRMFPEMKYIYWIRDPRDSILKQHKTDDIAEFGIEYDRTDDIREQRAISWKYQSELYKATPSPKNLIEVRFEDMVFDQERTLKRLEEFLGIPLARIEMRSDSVGRWKADEERHHFPFFQEELIKYGYIEETEGVLV